MLDWALSFVWSSKGRAVNLAAAEVENVLSPRHEVTVLSWRFFTVSRPRCD